MGVDRLNGIHVLAASDDGERGGVNNTVHVDRRSSKTPLRELGAGLVTYEGEDSVADWTTRYEEVLFVARGELTLRVNGSSARYTEGSLIAIEKGTTLTYDAVAGTQLVFALWPTYWAQNSD